MVLWIGKPGDGGENDLNVWKDTPGEVLPIPGNPFFSLTGQQSANVRDYAWAADGTLYVAGEFAEVNGITASLLAQRKNGVWGPVGTDQGFIEASGDRVSVDNAGVLYIGYNSVLGGSSLWKYENDTYTSLLCDGAIKDMMINPVSNDLWVCHQGSTIAGVSGQIHKFDGTTAIGWDVAGGDDTPMSVDINSSGQVYVGGSWATIDGVAATSIAKTVDNGANWIAVGTGLPSSGFVRFIAIDPNDETQIWVGGNGLGGGNENLKYFDSVNWLEVPDITSGPNGLGARGSFDPESGDLVIGGNWSSWDGGGKSSDNFMRWNGATWFDPLLTVGKMFGANSVRWHGYVFSIEDLGAGNVISGNVL